MGSSFSPFAAEFFMDHFENKLFSSKNPHLQNIFFWVRYVDDVFCVWAGTQRNLSTFLQSVLNNLDDNISFTLEYGPDFINFLDLSLSISSNKLVFEIYRKETSTDSIIPASSAHPWSIKMSAFHSMIDRLLRVPLSKDSFKKELKIIKDIAARNGYGSQIIDRLLQTKSRKLALQSIFPNSVKNEPPSWRKIPYIPGVSEKLCIPLSTINVKPAFFNNYTLKNALCNNKIRTKTPTYSKSGVYKVTCKECNGVYIGKTSRSISKRFMEHIKASVRQEPSSGLAQHIQTSGHGCSLDDVSLLHCLPAGRVLDKYEIFEINKHKNSNILNCQIDLLNNSPLLN